MVKKLRATFLLLLVIFPLFTLSFAPSAKAQALINTDTISKILEALNALSQKPCPATTNQWWNQDDCNFRKKVFQENNPQEIFGERYTYAQVNWIVNSIFVMISGIQDNSYLLQQLQFIFCLVNNPASTTCSPPSAGLTPDQTSMSLTSLGAPGVPLALLHATYANPAASGTDSISSSMAKLNLVPSAHAQIAPGFGYRSLQGIQTLWVVSRNMAYMIMVIMLIVSGFMIMFRVKINPQTVVTLQMMIPKIIITLVLVTFSYAIAGLLIELSYVIIGFVASLLAANTATGVNFGETMWTFRNMGFSALALYVLVPFIAAVIGGALLIVTPVGIITTIVMGIFLITLTILLFRIWWMLFKSYVTLLVLIIVGPWQIMLGLVPGQAGFSSWLRNIISNLAPFVIVALMFLLLMLVGSWPPILNLVGDLLRLDYIGTTASLTNPLLPGAMPHLPMFGSQGLLFMLAFPLAVLAMIPKVSQIVQDTLKTAGLNKYSSAFGEAFGPIGAPLGALGRAVGSEATGAFGNIVGAKITTSRAYQRFAGSTANQVTPASNVGLGPSGGRKP